MKSSYNNISFQELLANNEWDPVAYPNLNYKGKLAIKLDKYECRLGIDRDRYLINLGLSIGNLTGGYYNCQREFIIEPYTENVDSYIIWPEIDWE